MDRWAGVDLGVRGGLATCLCPGRSDRGASAKVGTGGIPGSSLGAGFDGSSVSLAGSFCSSVAGADTDTLAGGLGGKAKGGTAADEAGSGVRADKEAGAVGVAACG